MSYTFLPYVLQHRIYLKSVNLRIIGLVQCATLKHKHLTTILFRLILSSTAKEEREHEVILNLYPCIYK
jgi:hypothetical protein